MQNSTMTQNEGGDISTTKKAEDSKNDKPQLDQIIQQSDVKLNIKNLKKD